MKWQGSLLSLILFGSIGFAQQPLATIPEAPTPFAVPQTFAAPASDDPLPAWNDDQHEGGNGFLTGNHNFRNFIGYMSNPLFAIDPRSQTEMYPLFMSTSVKSRFLWPPNGSIQLYGAGLNVALTERLTIGLNQGGYAVSSFQHRTNDPFLTNLLVRLDRDNGGSRDGWLNLGGFVQYTVIEDVPNQFLLTTGLHWEAPSGEAEVFQGHGQRRNPRRMSRSARNAATTTSWRPPATYSRPGRRPWTICSTGLSISTCGLRVRLAVSARRVQLGIP